MAGSPALPVPSRFTLCSHLGNSRETACWHGGDRQPPTSFPKDADVTYKAEYIWIDGTEPTAKLRAKTKISTAKGGELPIWGFDGSSTNQAPGSASDCVLKPVFTCPDPIRGGDNVLVMNEVLLPTMKPHPTHPRAACAKTAKKFADHEPWFGIEQEYTFLKEDRPLGWP